MSARASRPAGAALALAAILASAPAAAAQRTDPFYATLADEGIRAYERGDLFRATEDLRIAAFGLLETPTELARVLTFLALTQSAGGDGAAFERSYGRLIELEGLFQAYSGAALDGSLRLALDRAAEAHLGAAALGTETPAAAEATAATSRPRLCISWQGEDDCRQLAAVAPPTEPESPAPATPGPDALAAFERLDRLTLSEVDSRQVRAGFEEASALADRYPDWAKMQRVAAVLASRSGSFANAVRYYELAGEASDTGPIELFFLSVALFETDQLDEAATVLRRVLPQLEQTGMVRKYVKLILDVDTAG